MKLLKNILDKIIKSNQEFNNQEGTSWLEHKRQWLEENNLECH